jgi:hypothetical protein
MKIKVTRSGGFMAMRPQTTEITTDSLPPAEKAPLEALATSLPEETAAPPGGDQFQYDVTVEHEGGTQSYTFHGEQHPAADLVARVQQIAKRPAS